MRRAVIIFFAAFVLFSTFSISQATVEGIQEAMPWNGTEGMVTGIARSDLTMVITVQVGDDQVVVIQGANSRFVIGQRVKYDKKVLCETN